MIALFERYTGYVLTLIIIILNIHFKWDYSRLGDYGFLFPNLISITSIAIGFLATILFQLWSYKKKSIMKYFKEYGYLGLLKFYSIETICFLLLLILSSLLLGIYFDSYLFSNNGFIFTTIFNSILVLSISSLVRIIFLFFKIDKLITFEDDNNVVKHHPDNNFHFDKIDD